MTQTLTALYQTRADADAARDKLNAAGLGAHVDVHDDSTTSNGESHDSQGFVEKLRGMFGAHRDTHTYAEGVRRGHILLTAKVDELRATQAAELLSATTAVDIHGAEANWKSEGWTAPAAIAPVDYAGGDEMNAAVPTGPDEGLYGTSSRVRSYPSIDSSATSASSEQVGEGVVAQDTSIRGADRQSNIDIGDVNTPSSLAGVGTSRPV